MAENKDRPVWTNLERTFKEALDNYLKDKDLSTSEFVRACIIDRLLDEGYLGQEQLETVLK